MYEGKKPFYVTIELEDSGYKLRLELKDDDMISKYMENPTRFEETVKAHLASAKADVLMDEGLDGIVSDINLEALEKKLRLVEQEENTVPEHVKIN